MKLSANFSLEELTESQTAARLGIDNMPDAIALDNLRRVAVVLEEIRTAIRKPIRVSSGYRSPAVNAAVGGSKNSAHTLGLAADIAVDGMTPKALAVVISTLPLPIDQVILEYDRWVHVGLSRAEPRGQLLTIRNGTGYMVGLV